ncbi:MAG: peptidylprolyl isomerase [Rhodoferax sp.]
MSSTRLIKSLCAVAGLALGAATALAQSAAAMPTVNGEALSGAQYARRVQAAVASGQADSAQLREGVMQDMVNRQLLLKEAQKRALDKDPDFLSDLAMVREDMLVDRLLHKQSDPAAITAAELKAEYERQVQALGPASELKEYQLRLIMLKSRDAASEVIKSLQKGAAFDKLAREKSQDRSRDQGGQVGWVLPQTITPAVAGVMTNLPKGSASVTPIETPAGWAVIRVEDVRPYKVPALENSREQLVAAIVMHKRAELVQGLRSGADVKFK